MTDQVATNITWHDGEVTRAERETNLGQKGDVRRTDSFAGAQHDLSGMIRRPLLEHAVAVGYVCARISNRLLGKSLVADCRAGWSSPS